MIAIVMTKFIKSLEEKVTQQQAEKWPPVGDSHTQGYIGCLLCKLGLQ